MNKLEYHRLTTVAEITKYQVKCAFCEVVITDGHNTRSSAAQDALWLGAVCLRVERRAVVACKGCKTAPIVNFSLTSLE